MRTPKTLIAVAAMSLAGTALAAEPTAEYNPTDQYTQVLSSLSAAAVVDAKLLPAVRSGVVVQAKTWHRGAQRRLQALPACGSGQAVACVEVESTTLAERSKARPTRQRDNAGGGAGPDVPPAVLAP